MSVWQRWLRQPQSVWLRKALFQIHLWTGIGVGLYILMISLTSSVLVYRNELYRAATPEPIVVKGSGPRLTDDQLKEAATRTYPGYLVTKNEGEVPLRMKYWQGSLGGRGGVGIADGMRNE
jgi:hypothetical protein